VPHHDHVHTLHYILHYRKFRYFDQTEFVRGVAECVFTKRFSMAHRTHEDAELKLNV
jgi:hypothetical protein